MNINGPHGLQRTRLFCPPPLKFMSVEPVMPSNHLILCCPLLLPSVFPSIRVFSGELALHIRWPKYWSFSFNMSPSSEHPGLISFRMDWLDLLWNCGVGEDPSPGDLPDPGIEPRSPVLEADALTSEPPGKPPLEMQILRPPRSAEWAGEPASCI